MAMTCRRDDESMRRAVKVDVAWTSTRKETTGERDDSKNKLLYTISFQSFTHFSIHGTRLWTTNSRVNLAVCWISSSPILSVLRTSPEESTFFPLSSFPSSFEGGGGNRGINAGTGTGGGDGLGSASRRR